MNAAEEALTLARELDDVSGAAASLDTIGLVLHRSGRRPMQLKAMKKP